MALPLGAMVVLRSLLDVGSLLRASCVCRGWSVFDHPAEWELRAAGLSTDVVLGPKERVIARLLPRVHHGRNRERNRLALSRDARRKPWQLAVVVGATLLAPRCPLLVLPSLALGCTAMLRLRRAARRVLVFHAQLEEEFRLSGDGDAAGVITSLLVVPNPGAKLLDAAGTIVGWRCHGLLERMHLVQASVLPSNVTPLLFEALLGPPCCLFTLLDVCGGSGGMAAATAVVVGFFFSATLEREVRDAAVSLYVSVAPHHRKVRLLVAWHVVAAVAWHGGLGAVASAAAGAMAVLAANIGDKPIGAPTLLNCLSRARHSMLLSHRRLRVGDWAAQLALAAGLAAQWLALMPLLLPTQPLVVRAAALVLALAVAPWTLGLAVVAVSVARRRAQWMYQPVLLCAAAALVAVPLPQLPAFVAGASFMCSWGAMFMVDGLCMYGSSRII